MQKGLSIFIDPSGAQTGGRVVKRELKEIGDAAITTQQRVDQLTRAQEQMAKSAQGSALAIGQQQDALRAKFNPTFAVLQRYKQTQEEIRQAHRLGAISVNEMTAALSRERQASLAALSAIKGHSAAFAANTAAIMANNTATRAAAMQRANLLFQLNDIGVSLASGMNPLMVAIQQGSQIGQIYGAGEGGIGRAFKETAAMATALVARIWPLAAALGAVYGAYKLVQSYSLAARTDVDALTRSMAEQAMSASSLKGAISDFASMREALVDASGISGALGNLISLQGSYSAAIGNTGTVQAQVSSTVVDNLRREFNAKRAVLEVEAQLQQAKIATMRADIAIRAQQFENEIGKSVFTNGNLEAQGFYDPRIGRFTQLPDDVSGLQKTQEAIDRLNKNPDFLAFKKLKADLSAAEVAADQLNATLKTSFEDVALGKGMDNLTKLSTTAFAPAVQGATALSTAVGGIAMAAETANTGVVNVTQSLANARMQTLSAMQQTSSQISTMKQDLADIQATLAAAAKTPAAEIFGNKLTGQAAADAIANASNSIQKVMLALRDGGTTAAMAHESIELVRQSLIAMGADSKAVDQFINGMVAGYIETVRLKGAIDQLSAEIMGIPNRVISIGIQQYTVPSAGGGTKGVNVYGGNADFSYSQYQVGGGKTVGVSAGNGSYGGQSGYYYDSPYDMQTLQQMGRLSGTRAAGGPVSAGGTYLVGENGPELLTMSGAGNVTDTNSTAAILSGGRDTLSLIEDHLYDVVQELRIHTNYWETAESEFSEMVACLKSLKSAVSSGGGSYSGGSSYSRGSSRGSYGGSSGSSGGQSHLDPYSPYYFNAARNFAGTGGGRYDPVADAMLNGNVGALAGVGQGPGYFGGAYLSSINIGGAGSSPTLLDRLKRQVGFASGGQIMPGEDQRVEFFKKNSERVIVVDDSKISDRRSGNQQPARSERPIQIVNNFHGGDIGDARSRQSMEDQFRRAVQQAVRR